MQVRASRWGNGLGVRIPKALAALVGLREGSRVDVRVEAGRPLLDVERQVFELEDLLAGLTPEAMSEAFDWGPDVGREGVE